MNKIKAIIIDDEANGRENLRNTLAKFCPVVEVVDEANSALAGIEAIQEYQPDLIFLDIEMPGGNGFQVLEFFENPDFGVIFVTAYDKYAIQAIRFSAIDYILKPLNVLDLKAAVDRFLKRKRVQSQQMLLQFNQNMKVDYSQRKITLPTGDSIEFHLVGNIVRCEGESNYTRFFFVDGSHLLISKSLIEFEELLGELGFIRTHKTHLVNMQHVKSYCKSDGGYLEMHFGNIVPVSRRRKDDVLMRLKNFSGNI